jgi:hypothetical protein
MIGPHRFLTIRNDLMLEEFDNYFNSVDVKELKAFLHEAKEESLRIKAQEGINDKEAAEIVKFMSALLESIEEEIGGLKSLSGLEFKKKVRLYAMIHLFHDICSAMDEDEFDEDFDYDEDFEEEEEESSNEK